VSPLDAGGSAPEQDHTVAKIELLTAARQFDSAATLAGAYLAAHPDDPAAWAALGEAQQGLGHGADAVASFRRALAADPHGYKAACCLAFALRRDGDLAGALHVARILVRMHPQVWGSHLTLASVALAAKEPMLTREAYAAAYRAVELEPNEAENHVILGLAARELGDLPTARRAYDAALALDPNSSAALNNRATVLPRGRGRWRTAIDGFARSAALDPDDRVARHNLEATVWNTLNRARFVAVPAALLAIVFGVAVRASAAPMPIAVIGAGVVAAVWLVWSVIALLRIPHGLRSILRTVAWSARPVRLQALALTALAVITVAAVPLSRLFGGVELLIFPALIGYRVVSISTLRAMNARLAEL
jgi:tetratricopeptide (TPR) repeat protein